MDAQAGAKKRHLAAGGALALVALSWLLWWRSPPQMGGDREAVKAVDALFTAITARDERLLDQCDAQLRAHKDAGNLVPAAAEHLDGIVAEARSKQWESAARRLYDFMKAQRPDGTRRKGDM